MKFLLPILLAGLLSGCALAPLKPGRVSYTSPNGATITTQQSQNPKSATTQVYKRTEETKDGKTIEEINTVLGSAQKDTTREIGAKLASMRWMQVLGVLVFLFGAASLFNPTLKLLIGSTTTSLAIVACGLALMFLPVIVVGNEALLLALSFGSLAVAGAWFFAIRYGKLRGFVDANKDGIDDRKQ